MIKYIFFDLGLTLVHNNMPQRYKTAFKNIGIDISIEDAQRAYHLANKYYMREKKGMLAHPNKDFLKEYLTVVCGFLQIENASSLLVEELKKLPPIKWEAFDFTHQALQELKDSGYYLGLISNWDLTCREVLSENNLTKYLSTIIVSEEVGIEKPNKEIFNFALQDSKANVKECLYVGDNYYDDAIGADKVGMKCCIINPASKIGIEEVNHSFIINNISQLKNLLDSKVFDEN